MNKQITSFLFLLIVILVFLGVNKNMDKIMAYKADYYFRKNNLTTAQKYYEKAFDLGFSSTEARDCYVNSLINSPLTLQSQEKLEKFLNINIYDNAKLKVEYFFYDLKREIHNKYPHNYINLTTHNQKVVRWSDLPITYGYTNADNVPPYYIDEIDNAFNEWERATEHQLFFEKVTQNPNIIIDFSANNPAEEDVYKYVVAYTTPTIATNKLKNSRITFYVKDPQGALYSKNQIYNTALHEIVHALGFMGHSNEPNNIMYLAKDSKTVSSDLRETLTQGDINTIKLLYKIKPDISNSDKNNSLYTPFLVLGSDEEINISKTREAKTYIQKAPELAIGYVDMAENYVASKEYAKAIKNLEKALQLANTDEILWIVYYNLAASYFYIGHYEMTNSYLEKAREIKDSEEIHHLQAETYIKEKKYKEAAFEYNILRNKNPENIEYTIGLTNLYVRNKNFIKARQTLRKFTNDNPKEKENPRFKPYGILMLFL